MVACKCIERNGEYMKKWRMTVNVFKTVNIKLDTYTTKNDSTTFEATFTCMLKLLASTEQLGSLVGNQTCFTSEAEPHLNNI
jgi:hypothetical protein